MAEERTSSLATLLRITYRTHLVAIDRVLRSGAVSPAERHGWGMLREHVAAILACLETLKL